jgi:lactobin A/cerein 7B family class IIb bacteriocin
MREDEVFELTADEIEQVSGGVAPGGGGTG